MKKAKALQETIMNLLITILLLMPVQIIAQVIQPKKIIYETDMCLDVDDVGALAILHAMENMGEVELLAVCFNEEHPNGAGTIDAINTWYGRGDIPIGIYKGNLVNDWSSNSSYLNYIDNNFSNDIDKESADSALTVYSQTLLKQPDSSVTIISVGFLNNLNDLLLAEPELIEQKVAELVIMAGVNNDGFNFVMHNLVNVSENVLRNWPTPIVISQAGGSIYTGDNLSTAPIENPVRWAYYKWFDNSFQGRSSWDQMAVLYGVRGLSTYFTRITSGSGSLSNGYSYPMVAGWRSYLGTRISNSTFERIIEELMDQLPLGVYFDISKKTGWLPFSTEFDASNSNVSGDRTIEEYLWDFGDGSSGEGETATHEYTSIGEFEVRLTIIDNLGDSLQATDWIRVSDPIFSLSPYLGNVFNFQRNQEDLWSTQMDSGNLRYYLSNDPRDTGLALPGFCFVRDSIYSDFALHLTSRIDEDLSLNSLADFSIIFGYIDKENYNQLFLKHSSARIVSVSNRQSLFIAATSRDGIPDDHYHDLSVNLTGDQLTVSLDDRLLLSVGSTRLQKTGKIGFGSDKYAMYFDDISVDGNGSPTSVDLPAVVPSEFLLLQNYPNPFNPSTTIRFSLPRAENVVIEIYNSLGQKLQTLVNQPMSAGSHEVVFNGQNLISGVYLCKISTGKFQDMKKMILLK